MDRALLLASMVALSRPLVVAGLGLVAAGAVVVAIVVARGEDREPGRRGSGARRRDTLSGRDTAYTHATLAARFMLHAGSRGSPGSSASGPAP
jgi:hypothetical protein